MIKTGVAALAVALTLAGGAAHAEESATRVSVAKTATCGCCTAWIEHLERNGFVVEAEDMASGQLVRFKLENGVPEDLMSCHTAKVEGYTIEGHVPAADIREFLDERPDAVGLAVPGMPLGSPGMDFGEDKEPYEVMLVRQDGSSEAFSSYPAD